MYKQFFKRLIDIILGIFTLPIILFFILIFGPIIYLEDKGPIFYISKRVGKDMIPFNMYKLRTMYVNSEDIRNNDGSTYNSKNDSRVTKIGRFLRKTSIDEFPQFLNVIKGDMSLIGPRPTLEVNIENDKNAELHKKRYSVRPGITGYVQAYYRNSITAEQKLQFNCYYVDNITFLMDCKIFLYTIMSVLKHKNINTN